jgi:hypothetical protein
MYKIKSIEIANDVDMGTSQIWYRYVIANEFNTITCLRSGSKTEVLRYARLCTMLLNKKYKSGKVKVYKPMNHDALFYS